MNIAVNTGRQLSEHPFMRSSRMGREQMWGGNTIGAAQAYRGGTKVEQTSCATGRTTPVWFDKATGAAECERRLLGSSGHLRRGLRR